MRQVTCAGGLHGVERPEAAGNGIIAARQRTAGVRLADGAAHGKNAAGAGVAATGDFIPVNGVTLPGCLKVESREQKAETEQCGPADEAALGKAPVAGVGDWGGALPSRPYGWIVFHFVPFLIVNVHHSKRVKERN